VAVVNEDDRKLAEAEIGVIGSALIEPDLVIGVLARWGVKPEWFSSVVGRTIAEAMMPMHADGEPVDLLTLGAKLRRCGHLEIADSLEGIYDKVPTAKHVGHYLAMLRDGWMSRAAREASFSMSKMLADPSRVPKDAVATMVGTLTALMEAGCTGQSRSPYEVRKDALDLWTDAANGKRSALGLPWPMYRMNDLTCGMYPGINVLAARPSVGKTMMEGVIARHLMMNGKRVARACLDMAEEPFLTRDLCALSGESLNKMRSGHMTGSDRTKLELTLLAMKGWKEHLLPERTSEGIVARARAIHAQHGLDLLTVDYAQLLDVTVAGRDNDNVRISKAVARLKEFSVSLGVPVLLLSQLSREVEKEGRLPQLSDLRDSGSIEQEATSVVFLFAEPVVSKKWLEKQGLKEFKELSIRPVVWGLLKNQNGMTGTVGLRQLAKYFQIESAMKTEEYSEDWAHGYDFSRAEQATMDQPDCNQYVISRHARGAVEAFALPWFERVNAAAAANGLEGYAEVRRASGVEHAMSVLQTVRHDFSR
jgi:replicative DNA helicase